MQNKEFSLYVCPWNYLIWRGLKDLDFLPLTGRAINALMYFFLQSTTHLKNLEKNLYELHNHVKSRFNLGKWFTLKHFSLFVLMLLSCFVEYSEHREAARNVNCLIINFQL